MNEINEDLKGYLCADVNVKHENVVKDSGTVLQESITYKGALELIDNNLHIDGIIFNLDTVVSYYANDYDEYLIITLNDKKSFYYDKLTISKQ